MPPRAMQSNTTEPIGGRSTPIPSPCHKVDPIQGWAKFRGTNYLPVLFGANQIAHYLTNKRDYNGIVLA